MLDDKNVLKQRDPQGALQVAAEQFAQTQYKPVVVSPDHDDREITRVVVAGMGGSALAALAVKAWLGDAIALPFEVVRTYTLPSYVDHNTLVIASSYSGNTEETISCLEDARDRGAQVGILASGGTMADVASRESIAHVLLPEGLQPRMAVIYNLKGLVALLANFGIVEHSRLDEITNLGDWLKRETAMWHADSPTTRNYAKQLALFSVGKTAVFYGGSLTSPVAYKWKISWNENAKNTAFSGELPEFNHNEFIGWTSHPVEKPFAVFNIVSAYEHPRILRRFEVSDRLLSGQRPQAARIQLVGSSLLAQILWGSILADFVSIYVAVLNGVNPTPVELIERLKKELAA